MHVDAGSLSSPAPQNGPRLLFFGGGTGLNAIANEIKYFTHNSVHLVPPFDSGGSSAALRRVYAMPAVGDLRSRLLALADDDAPDTFKIRAFLAHRLSSHGAPANALHQELLQWRRHRLTEYVSHLKAQAEIGLYLDAVINSMPADFDLRDASIGNLVLTGAYLENQRNIETATACLSRLLGTLGVVSCTVSDDLHLAARLDDGQIIFGQHRITGKEVLPLSSGIADTWLNASEGRLEPARCVLPDFNRQRIAQADTLIYGPGSFHSSLLAHFLPEGTAAAVAEHPGSKIYIPNLGLDPELVQRTPMQALHHFLERLQQSAGSSPPFQQLLNLILVDQSLASQFCRATLKDWGIRLVATELTSPNSPYYNPQKLVQALLANIQQPLLSRL
jgi:CofD-related protein of GAK system